jgi:hypothetical protein
LKFQYRWKGSLSLALELLYEKGSCFLSDAGSDVPGGRFAMTRLMSFGLGLAAMAMKRLVALGLSRRT